MNGGKVMLLATIISAAFAANPAVEAQVLKSKTSVICKQNKPIKSRAEIERFNKTLNEKHVEMQKLVTVWRDYYYQVSEQPEDIDQAQYNDLQRLAVATTAVTDYLKNLLIDERDHIVKMFGDNTYALFRDLVAMQGQVKKNVLNVLAVYDGHFGNYTVMENPAFSPKREFWNIAINATQAVYGQH